MRIPSGPFTQLRRILLPEARGPVEVDMRATAMPLPGALSLTVAEEGEAWHKFCLDFDALDDPEARLA